MPLLNFWGIPCLSSPTRAGNSVGAVFAHRPEGRILLKVFELGERIAAAGEDGLSIDDAEKSDVDVLRGAGVEIEERNYRLRIANLPAPIAYLTPVPATEPALRRVGPHLG